MDIRKALGLFRNGQQRFNKSPMFNRMVRMLCDGFSSFEIMDQLILTLEDKIESEKRHAIITDPDKLGDIKMTTSERIIEFDEVNKSHVNLWELQLYIKTDGKLTFPKEFDDVDKFVFIELVNFGELEDESKLHQGILDFLEIYKKFKEKEQA